VSQIAVDRSDYRVAYLAYAGFNAAIAPGASVGTGFQANQTGNAGAPTSFTLNGATCVVG